MPETASGPAGFVETFLVRPGPEMGVYAAAAECVPGELPQVAVLPTDTPEDLERAVAAHAQSASRHAWRRGQQDGDGGEARAVTYRQGWEAHARRAIHVGRQVVAVTFQSEKQRWSYLRSVCGILIQNPDINEAIYGGTDNQG